MTVAENALVSVSKLASAAPVAVLSFGGTSFDALRSAFSAMTSANAAGATTGAPATSTAARIAFFDMIIALLPMTL